MSILHVCDRCGAQSSDPRTEGWVVHLVSKEFSRPVDGRDLAREDDLCRPCREGYEDWMKVPLDE